MRRLPNIKPTSHTKRWPSAGMTLVQRLRRWPSIKPALGQRLAFAGIIIYPSSGDCRDHVVYIRDLSWGVPCKHDTSAQCFLNAGPLSALLAQPWINSVPNLVYGSTQCVCKYRGHLPTPEKSMKKTAQPARLIFITLIEYQPLLIWRHTKRTRSLRS